MTLKLYILVQVNRAVKTAEILRGDSNIPIILEENLREINMGEWEGQTISYIEETFKETFYSFWHTPHLYHSLVGEDFFTVRERVEQVVNDILEKYSVGNVLIVTHSVTIKTLLAYFKKLPMERLWDPPFIHDTSLSIVNINDYHFDIVMEGDLSHRK